MHVRLVCHFWRRKKLIRQLDSRLADYIDWLEEGIRKFGSPDARQYPKWGSGPSMSDIKAQKTVQEFIEKNPDIKMEMSSFVCGTECGPGTMRGLEER